MITNRRFLLIALLPALLLSAEAARADDTASWDGTWTGTLGRPPGAASPIAITIAEGKVVSYTLRGAPFVIQYSKVTPTNVSFGDHDNYSMKIKRTGETTATARVHGRIGYGVTTLTKQ
jgi:hypothetical protein